MHYSNKQNKTQPKKLQLISPVSSQIDLQGVEPFHFEKYQAKIAKEDNIYVPEQSEVSTEIATEQDFEESCQQSQSNNIS